MERFKKYSDKKLDVERVKDESKLSSFGITCRYLPDPPEEFDEFEFVSTLEKEGDLGFVITIVEGEIKKILFGLIDEKDPDIIRPLSDEKLLLMLANKGGDLTGFFDWVTGG